METVTVSVCHVNYIGLGIHLLLLVRCDFCRAENQNKAGRGTLDGVRGQIK